MIKVKVFNIFFEIQEHCIWKSLKNSKVLLKMLQGKWLKTSIKKGQRISLPTI